MLIEFNLPENLDGAILIEELEAEKININTKTSPMIDGNNKFWLDISEKDTEKAAEIVAQHGRNI